MQKPKPTTVYRSLLSDALRVAWGRKQLWVFGLFAALLSTGGAWEMTAKSFHRLSTVRDACVQVMRGTFTGTQMFGRSVRDMIVLEPSRATGVATIIIVAVLLAVIASVVSQGALVAGTGKKEVADAEAIRAGRSAFWDLLALNLLHKAAHAVVTLIAAIPLFALITSPTRPDVVVTFLVCLVVFPLTIVISILFMLASVDAAKKGTHALDAIHHAVRVWTAHWLAALELGLILFLSALLAGVLFLTVVALLAIPFAVLVSASLVFGSSTVFLLVNVFGAFLFVLLLFGFVGMLTTFQYAAWGRFYEHGTGKKKVISKTHRIWSGR